MRHPILVAFDEKRLRGATPAPGARRHRHVAGAALRRDGPHPGREPGRLPPRPAQRRPRAGPRPAQESVRLRRDRERLQRWNEVLRKESLALPHRCGRVFLCRWAPSAPPEVFTGRGQNLATGFVRTALGVEDDDVVTAVAADLRAKCAPDDSRERLIEAAFELQTEKEPERAGALLRAARRGARSRPVPGHPGPHRDRCRDHGGRRVPRVHAVPSRTRRPTAMSPRRRRTRPPGHCSGSCRSGSCRTRSPCAASRCSPSGCSARWSTRWRRCRP